MSRGSALVDAWCDMVRPAGIRHDGGMSNRLSLAARTRLLFVGSAFLVLVVGLLVPWIRTGAIVRAYQGRALMKPWVALKPENRSSPMRPSWC